MLLPGDFLSRTNLLYIDALKSFFAGAVMQVNSLKDCKNKSQKLPAYGIIIKSNHRSKRKG